MSGSRLTPLGALFRVLVDRLRILVASFRVGLAVVRLIAACGYRVLTWPVEAVLWLYSPRFRAIARRRELDWSHAVARASGKTTYHLFQTLH